MYADDREARMEDRGIGCYPCFLVLICSLSDGYEIGDEEAGQPVCRHSPIAQLVRAPH